MATIDSLRTSITQLSRYGIFRLLHEIRSKRRERPPARKAAPAKVKRAPNKRAPKQQDLFAMASKMSQTQKDKLAAELLKELLS